AALPSVPLPNHPLYVMRVDGTDARQIVPAGLRSASGEGGTILMLPRFSPDGTKVAYCQITTELKDGRFVKYESSLSVVDRDGGGRRVVIEGNADDGHPHSVVWSPDGKMFALGFRKLLGDTARDGGLNRLFIVDADGKNLREIPLPHPTNLMVL